MQRGGIALEVVEVLRWILWSLLRPCCSTPGLDLAYRPCLPLGLRRDCRFRLPSMSSLVPMLVLALASLLVAMVARALAGGAVAMALFLTLLVGGGMVLAINRR